MFLLWLGEQITSARDRQRRVADHHGRHRRPAPAPLHLEYVRRRAAPGADQPFVIGGFVLMLVVLVADDLLHGARAAPSADPVSEARQPARHDAGGSQPSAAEAQHRGRDPADLRQLAAAAAADHHPVRRQCVQTESRGRRGPGHAQPVSPARRSRSTWRSMPLGIIFFCFFYTAVVFNPEETADNLKKQRRLHPRHPPGQEHRRHISITC